MSMNPITAPSSRSVLTATERNNVFIDDGAIAAYSSPSNPGISAQMLSVKESIVIMFANIKDDPSIIEIFRSAEMKTVAKTFGTRNSAVYREMLFNMFKGTKMSADPTSIFFLYYMASIIKNRNRIVQSWDSLPETLRTKDWARETRTFIANKCVQYTKEETAGKFSFVHVPMTNPGIDILCWCLWASEEDRTVENFFKRTTSVQLRLNKECQLRAMEGYKFYWLETVNGTRNTRLDRNDSIIETRENWLQYYQTSASDGYHLVDQDFKEIPAPVGGYTIADIETFLGYF